MPVAGKQNRRVIEGVFWISDIPTRKANRLRGYDYSQNGAYFVTVCAKDRREIFGNIVGDGLARPAYTQLSEYGTIVEDDLRKIPMHYCCVTVDCYIVMPNHIHAIIIINDNAIQGRASPSPTLGNIVGGFKSGVSRRCDFPIWQRSYHDHIIRARQCG